jgi:hypothetical protein
VIADLVTICLDDTSCSTAVRLRSGARWLYRLVIYIVL